MLSPNAKELKEDKGTGVERRKRLDRIHKINRIDRSLKDHGYALLANQDYLFPQQGLPSVPSRVHWDPGKAGV